MRGGLKHIQSQVSRLNTDGFKADPKAWFEAQPGVGREAWFLAHADDGVIWGKLRDGTLVTSNEIFSHISPPLRAETLQEARLFGEKAEVRIWRDRRGFSACRIEDQDSEGAEAFDETYVLWGTRMEKQDQGFTLVTEGRQGLRHAVPLQIEETTLGSSGTTKHPLRLRVRHYIAYDEESGQAFLALSRLVELFTEGGQG